jgi:hypothetical protein
LLGFVGLALLPLACDYKDTKRQPPRSVAVGPLPTSVFSAPSAPNKSATKSTASTTATAAFADTPEQREKREAILTSVLRLIENAGTTAEGDSFAIAAQNLNQYFEVGTIPPDYVLTPESRAFLAENLNEPMIKEIESRVFDQRVDALHIEDCMIYHAVASRIAGEGDDMTRVRRIFDWMVRHVQLIPPMSLAAPNGLHAQARPADVMLRGMAAEAEGGYWTERGWLFMALCRQIGVDVGLVSYQVIRPPSLLSNQPDSPGSDDPIIWASAAIIDGKAYLFDHRLGIPIPNAKGDGIATIEEAFTNPQILGRLDLPGQSKYGTTQKELLASPIKVTVLLDSSRGYYSPKMRLLQSRLAGKNRTILYRDVAEQAISFVQAIGKERLGNVRLWQLPLIVENGLFNNPAFNTATQYGQRIFDKLLPLRYARLAQLKGETSEAIKQYVAIRFASGAVMRDKKTVIPASIQRELDVHATHFLGLANLELNNKPQAEFFFKQLLSITPNPGPQVEPCFMFRWGANTNLAYLNVDKGDLATATRYFAQPDFRNPISRQSHGNLWQARQIVWNDPMAPLAEELPPAPAYTQIVDEKPKPATAK